MRKPTLLTVAAVPALLTPTVQAVGFVQWDIHKRHHPQYALGRRAAGFQQETINNSVARGGYFATCTLGTPGQNVILQLDTGSSDIWVPWNQASVCSSDRCTLGTCK